MKIAYLHTNVYGIGGTIRTVFNQAAALATRHDVEIVSVLYRRGEPLLAPPAGVTVTGLVDRGAAVPPERGVGDRPLYEGNERAGQPSRYYPPEEGSSPNYSLLTDDRIGEYLRHTDADVVVGTRAGLNVLLARMAPERLVVVGQEHLTYHMYADPFMAVMHREYPRLNALVTVTEADERTYRARMRLPDVRLRTIPNCVPEPEILADDRCRRTVVAAGRLTGTKRYDLLVDAFARVAPDFPDWSLRLYGRGGRRRALCDQVIARGLEDRALIMGPNPHLEEAWALGSIAAVTSSAEAFGMSIVEAMRAGLPVVSTDCPNGPAEIIRDGEDGLLVENGAPDAVAAGLRRLMADDAERVRMGAAARRNAARFDPVAVARQYEDLFHELVRDRSRSVRVLSTPRPPLRERCVATARPDGSCEVTLTPAPRAVVLRADGEEVTRLTPDGSGTVVAHPDRDSLDGPREYAVWRVDDGHATPVEATRVDLRAYPLDPATTKRPRLVLPHRDDQRNLLLSVRADDHHAEVRRVDSRGPGITVSGTALGVTAAAPDARLVLTTRRRPRLVREVPCPVADNGDFTAEIPFPLLAEEHREDRERWDLRLSVGSADEYRLGRCLDGVVGHKRVIRYPQRLVGDGAGGYVTVRPYYTTNDRLAVEVTDALAPEETARLLAAAVRDVTATWSPDLPPDLVLTGHLDACGSHPATPSVRVTHEDGTAALLTPLTEPTELGLRFRTRIPLDMRVDGRPLAGAWWRITLSVEWGEDRVEVPLRPGNETATRAWWCGVRPMYAVTRGDATDGLRLAVNPVPVRAGVRYCAGRLVGRLRS